METKAFGQSTGPSQNELEEHRQNTAFMIKRAIDEIKKEERMKSHYRMEQKKFETRWRKIQKENESFVYYTGNRICNWIKKANG